MSSVWATCALERRCVLRCVRMESPRSSLQGVWAWRTIAEEIVGFLGSINIRFISFGKFWKGSLYISFHRDNLPDFGFGVLWGWWRMLEINWSGWFRGAGHIGSERGVVG